MAYGNGLNAPTGFTPVRYLNGSSWNEQTNQYRITHAFATTIGQGDLVSITGNGVLDLTATAAASGGAGHGQPTVGVFLGCEYLDSTGKKVFSNQWVANTPTFQNGYATAYVVDDPNVLFSAQMGAGTLTLAVTDLYNNIDFVAGAPNAVGVSTAYISQATVANDSTLTVKIYDLDPKVGNAFGINYNTALVLLNNHSYKSVGTAGV